MTVNAGFNDINLPVLIITVFYIAVFYANMTISVPTILAVRELLKELGESSRTFTSCIGTFLEFLVSINRMQDFLLWEEADLSAIKFKEDKDVSIKIDPSHFFWGFDKQAEVEMKKTATKNKNQKQNLTFSYTSKLFLM